MRQKTLQSHDDDLLEEPLINLTPLIDVVFVVLITFILIAPALDIDSINLASGGAVERKELQTGAISIAVRADNSIWYKGVNMNLDQLEKQLRMDKKARPKEVPQVLHDKQASFGTYQALKNTLERIGFEQMDIVLKP